jgi:hypothetical protein
MPKGDHSWVFVPNPEWNPLDSHTACGALDSADESDYKRFRFIGRICRRLLTRQPGNDDGGRAALVACGYSRERSHKSW